MDALCAVITYLIEVNVRAAKAQNSIIMLSDFFMCLKVKPFFSTVTLLPVLIFVQ